MPNKEPRPFSKSFKSKGRTKQEFTKECDINTIMGKYQKSGILPEYTKGYFSDVSNFPDYQTAMEQITIAKTNFNQLNSDIRSKFENDPSKLLNFLKDEKNADEAYELGIINKPSEGQPEQEVPVNETEETAPQEEG